MIHTGATVVSLVIAGLVDRRDLILGRCSRARRPSACHGLGDGNRFVGIRWLIAAVAVDALAIGDILHRVAGQGKGIIADSVVLPCRQVLQCAADVRAGGEIFKDGGIVGVEAHAAVLHIIGQACALRNGDTSGAGALHHAAKGRAAADRQFSAVHRQFAAGGETAVLQLFRRRIAHAAHTSLLQAVQHVEGAVHRQGRLASYGQGRAGHDPQMVRNVVAAVFQCHGQVVGQRETAFPRADLNAQNIHFQCAEGHTAVDGPVLPADAGEHRDLLLRVIGSGDGSAVRQLEQSAGGSNGDLHLIVAAVAIQAAPSAQDAVAVKLQGALDVLHGIALKGRCVCLIEIF